MSAHDTHATPLDPSTFQIPDALWHRGRNALMFLFLAGALVSLAGYIGNPKQFFFSWLVGFLDCVTLVLGGMFFVMIQFLTGSAWSITVRRLMENIMMTIPVGIVTFLPIAFGLPYLFEWTHTDLMLKESALAGKASYLSPEWFLVRAAIYFALWTLFAWMIYRASTKQDTHPDIELMNTTSRWSAPGLLMVMLTATLASFDWIMSLDPHWYSTIFGIYVLVGGAGSFFAILTLTCLKFRQAGVLDRYINIEHYHDLGKWMFALTIFWGYIAISQYLLIWYSNLPEETVFFFRRAQGSWLWVSRFLTVGKFIIPFLVLMPRANKRSLKVLGFMGVWMATMHYIDLYWMVMPAGHPEGLHIHWMDFTCWLTVFSMFALVFWYRLKQHALMPVGDLRFDQALEFENV